ncbi:MAG: helix-turn-helix domain-containing protein [Kordiimonas sp.]
MTTSVFGEIGFLGMITVASALQGLLLAAYIAIRDKDTNQSSRWISLLITLISLHLLDMTFSRTELIKYFAPISNSSFFFLFLLGPAYFFHVRFLLTASKTYRWRDILHLMPSFLVFLTMLPWILAPSELKVAAQQNTEIEISIFTYLMLAANIIQIISYLAYSNRLIHSTRLTQAEQSADTEINQNIRVLEIYTKAYTGWALFYLITFFALVFWGQFGEVIDHTWLFISGLFIQVAGVISLTRSTLFTERLAFQENYPPTEREADKYERSTLSAEDCRALRSAFETLMETDKPYLNCELRLPTVAAKLNTTTHHLSQMLNQEIGDSFLKIINRYRVKEVMGLIEENTSCKVTVLELAYQAGFNNKNSFNRSFKEVTGMTPTAYKRQSAIAAE